MMIILAVIYIVFISLGLPDSTFGVAWPVVHLEFGAPESFASVYSVIIGLCTGGVGFFSGKLIRKFGTATVTLVSILLTVIAMVGISFSPNIVVMLLCSVVLGYGAGAIDTGLNNFVSLHYKSNYMNWLHCFWGIGVTLSPVIMSFFLGGETGSWRKGYRAVAAIQFAIFFITALSLKKWKQLENSPEFAVPKQATEEKTKSMLEIFKIKGVIQGVLSLGSYCAMEFLIGTWGASYAVNVFSLSPDIAAKWVSLYYGGIMLGRFISGFISVRLGDRRMIKLGIISAFVGIAVLMLPVGKASLIGFLFTGIGFGPIFPSVLHIIPERYGKTYSSDITGYHMGGAYFIGFAVQLVFGFAASATTFKITPFVIMGLCALLFCMNEITNRITAK